LKYLLTYKLIYVTYDAAFSVNVTSSEITELLISNTTLRYSLFLLSSETHH